MPCGGVAAEEPQGPSGPRSRPPTRHSPLGQDPRQLPLPRPSRARAPGCALPRVVSVNRLFPERETGPGSGRRFPGQSGRQRPLRRPPAPSPPCGPGGPNRPRGPHARAPASGQSPPRSEPHAPAERRRKAESISLTAEAVQASGTPACVSRTDGRTDTALRYGFNFLAAGSNRVSPVPSRRTAFPKYLRRAPCCGEQGRLPCLQELIHSPAHSFVHPLIHSFAHSSLSHGTNRVQRVSSVPGAVLGGGCSYKGNPPHTHRKASSQPRKTGSHHLCLSGPQNPFAAPTPAPLGPIFKPTGTAERSRGP